MRLSNGEVLLAWPLAQHIITQGWFYNDGSLHKSLGVTLSAIFTVIHLLNFPFTTIIWTFSFYDTFIL